MKMKKIYVGFAFSHHKHSQGGYHHIKDYIHYDKIIDAQWEKEFYESTSKNIFFRIFRRIYIYFLGQGTPITVIKCIFLAIFRRNQVFHFIYAENSYKWLHHFIGKSNKIVCTFHQPANFFVKNSNWIPILEKIDKIILMTDKDVIQFKKWTGKDNVFFIPHGVNCSYYKPNQAIKEPNSILMVGNWLRDFDLAAKVFSMIMAQRPEVVIKIVTNISNFRYFSNLNVQLYTDITDDELRNLYQSSNIVFFPLKAFTANNAVLEAASCGCKIMISVPKDAIDNSYFKEELINFIEPNSIVIANEILNNLKENLTKTENIHQYVYEKYSWENIGNQTNLQMFF